MSVHNPGRKGEVGNSALSHGALPCGDLSARAGEVKDCIWPISREGMERGALLHMFTQSPIRLTFVP